MNNNLKQLQQQQNHVLLFKLDKTNETFIPLKASSNLKLDLLNQIPDSSLIFTDG